MQPSLVSLKPDLRSTQPIPLRHADGSRIVGGKTLARAIAIAEAVFSRGGAPPPSDRLIWLERELEDYLARSGARSRRVLAFMLWLVSFAAPLLSRRFVALSAMGVPERVTALARLELKFGEPLLAVKAMLCLLYYEHPDVAREVGFDGACLTSPAVLMHRADS